MAITLKRISWVRKWNDVRNSFFKELGRKDNTLAKWELWARVPPFLNAMLCFKKR